MVVADLPSCCAFLWLLPATPGALLNRCPALSCLAHPSMLPIAELLPPPCLQDDIAAERDAVLSDLPSTCFFATFKSQQAAAIASQVGCVTWADECVLARLGAVGSG